MYENEDRKDSPILLVGQGKDFSEVAVESEGQFKSWLKASGVEESDLVSNLDSGAFQLTLNKEKNKAIIYLHRGSDLIAEPLVWVKETGILFSQFKVDAGLLLMMLASKCKKQESKNTIKGFVKGNLRVK